MAPPSLERWHMRLYDMDLVRLPDSVCEFSRLERHHAQLRAGMVRHL